MDKIPNGHKALKKGQTVYIAGRKYKNSCPIELHPDNRKDKLTKDKGASSDVKSQGTSGK